MLAIITPSKFLLELEPLKNHKEQTGLLTDIITLEDIYLKYTQGDEAERVKRCIADFEKKGFRFFFLIGDADNFPVRFTKTDRNVAEAYNTAFYPTDLYYACLYRQDGSFDDWNANKNQYYGELQGHPPNTGIINVDQVNMIPTVAVGRAPVSTKKELERYVNKIISYELQAFNAKWTKNALLLATHDWHNNACNVQEDNAKKHLKGYTSTLLFSAGSPCSGAGKLTASALTSWFNKGVGLIAYIGHGSASGLAIPNSPWGTANIPQLKNTKLPIMIVDGCETALFTGMLPPYGKYVDINNVKHNGTSGGELFTSPPPQPHCIQNWYDPDSDLATQLTVGTDAGVIAYIGGVTGMQFYTPLVYFLKGLQSCQYLGDAWKYMVQHYYQEQQIPSYLSQPNWGAVAANIQGWIVMLFGDPSLRIAGVKKMEFRAKTGKIMHLRVNDLNHQWGSGNDILRTEVIVQLDTPPKDEAFGFELREDDPNLPSRSAMLSVLRDAYVHKLTVSLAFDIEHGKKCGPLRRIDLSQ